MPAASFRLPGASLFVETNEERLLVLARRLWEETAPAPRRDAELHAAWTATSGPRPELLPERRLTWTLLPEVYSAEIPGHLAARITFEPPSVVGAVSLSLLEAFPSTVARYLLEAPLAALLGARRHQPLHAGAVIGPRGAVVIRGGSGAGKSTLVAAAWQAGLGVLGDESLLVSREDPDDLSSTVRDLTLLPHAARLLGLETLCELAFSGGEEKRRIDLFPGATPSDRIARRRATVLLGPRTPGPARLVPLTPEEFVTEFRHGEIPQERATGNPDFVARAWSAARAFRLEGALDLPGAVSLIASL
ncbi:MAG: hypothetical protein ABIT01_08810 [Thermoanaerobaculia bacterium]